ncbi:MAG: hypothetical protein ABI467_03350 [Kofleriaceae bacterium]
MTVLPDAARGASHLNAAAHLSGPFAGGARVTKLDFDAAGIAYVDWQARLPLLLVAPRVDVGATELAGTVKIVQSSGEVIEPIEVRFARYTEAGASVLAYRPGPPSMIGDHAREFTVEVDGGGEHAEPQFDLFVIEGNLGRLLYVATAEKMRLRRQASELFAMRQLAAADGRALERIGADLGVPRFDTKLVWDATLGLPTIAAATEADADYRTRLAIYRPLLRASRRAVDEMANGPGATTDPNRGLPAQLGMTARVEIEESDTELVIAMRIVGAEPQRLAYTAFLRKTILLVPGAPVADIRLVPRSERAETNALCVRLATTFTWPANPAIAPALARALDRVGKCRTALGVTRPWKVLRTQDDAGGSRYELGLGIDLEVPPAGELAALGQKHVVSGTTPEIEALIASMTPVPAAQDLHGRWLLEACLLPTVHSLDATKTYVSHLVTHGLSIGETVANGVTQLAATWNAPNDSGPDATLVLALEDADVARASAGVAAWTLLTGAAEQAGWAAAVAPPAGLVAAVTEAAIHIATDAVATTKTIHALAAVPNELVLTLQLDATLAAKLATHDAAATAQLLQLVIAFQRAGVTSLLPLYTSANQLLLVIGAVSLPGASTLLTVEKSSLRWYVVPIAGAPGTVTPALGSRTTWSEGEGISAIVVIAPGRRGTPDPRGRVAPFELRVSVPATTLLELEQYELLMNLFDRAHPLGVVVNTRNLRQQIDGNDDGTAEPISTALSRTYRPFRQPRRSPIEE